MGSTVKTFDRIVGGGEDAWCRPFPFCLASPLQEEVKTLGNPRDWWVEWKWDGIRCQLLSEEEKNAMDPRR